MTRRDDEHDEELPRDDEAAPDEDEAGDENDWDDEDDGESDAEDDDDADEDDDSSEDVGDEDDGWNLEQQSMVSSIEDGESPARRAGLLRFEEALTLEGQIEAVIFASPKALKVDEILEIVQTDDMAHTEQAIQAVVDQLVNLYAERNGGFRLEVLKGAYQFQTVPAAAPLMERLFSARPRPLSRAALETLSIIAYRQPVTRADVEFIRGVDAGSIIKNLLERDLIACVGRKEDAGRPMLFGTTQTFLEVFRLNNIKDLPPLSAFQPAQEMVTEATNKLEGEEAVDVEGFVADRENRELSDDEREFLAEDDELEAEAMDASSETAGDVAEGEEAEELSASAEDAAEGSLEDEADDGDDVDNEDEDEDEEGEASEDEEDDLSEEDADEEALAFAEEAAEILAAPEDSEDTVEAHPSQEDEAEAEAIVPDPDNPFWELDVAAQKTSKSPERVLKGASAKKRRGVRNDKDGADAASEVDSSAGAGVEAGGRDLDPGGEDQGKR